jgi:hypothetical protein
MLTAKVAKHLTERVPFTVSRITAALLHIKRASAGTSPESFRPQGQDKRDILGNGYYSYVLETGNLEPLYRISYSYSTDMGKKKIV